jgi:hypothetical protein
MIVELTHGMLSAKGEVAGRRANAPLPATQQLILRGFAPGAEFLTFCHLLDVQA